VESLNQNKQEQRGLERFELLFYSGISIVLAINVLYTNRTLWVPLIMLLSVVICWMVFLDYYKNFRIRACITTAAFQLTFVLYALICRDITVEISVFMAMTVLVALYGLMEPLWITVAAGVFLLLYHAAAGHIALAFSEGKRFSVLLQIGSVVCVEHVLFVWQKRRNEATDEVYRVMETLKESEKSKDDFLVNISHEIRTPANTIFGLGEVLSHEQNPQKVREEIADIQTAGQNLLALVNDILDFSRLQKGKIYVEEENYELAVTINDITSMFMARRGAKAVELLIDCEADVPATLSGDEKKIRRVITNLVDNAIKYTKEGCVCIAISVRRENYGVNLCVSVKDTGIGIGENEMERLFESFRQVDARRRRQGSGVGLGLPIAKALVENMGGNIMVRSKPERGTTVRFVVPQKVPKETPIIQMKRQDNINAAVYFNAERMTITAMRDEYDRCIRHIAEQLQLRCPLCHNLADLKRREEYETFSHIFIGLGEYLEDESYFDELSKRTTIIVVLDREKEETISNPRLRRMYKPFSILTAAAIFKEAKENGCGTQWGPTGKFKAPDAHILVVDDSEMNIHVAEGLLAEYGIRTTPAASGKKALELIENKCYDMVLMDHMMPDMDGVETLQCIREKPGYYYRNVPVVILTANVISGNRKMFLDAGFNDFLEKPIEISVLERVLKRNLPREKLLFESEQETSGEKKPEYGKRQTAEPDAEMFHIGDLDVKKGMLCCGGRKKYLEILRTYSRKGDTYRQQLEDFFAARDWENYTIKVHALKSSMQSIGAIKLSELAKALEQAGKKGDCDYLMANHAGMLAEYDRIMAELEHSTVLFPAGDAAVENVEENNGVKRKVQVGDSKRNMDEKTFDRFLKEMEEGGYALDGAGMKHTLTQMENYKYGGVDLQKELEPVRRKIEEADYMSALDSMYHLREQIQKEQGGGQKI
jgi:signal transduction histidine kinase/CheY-like chemotaxis protein